MPLVLGSFPEFLASTLRAGESVRVYHVCTSPAVVKPIFSSLPGAEDEYTTCESHFLSVSQQYSRDQDSTTSDTSSHSASREVLILGIEILVFDTLSLKTIFVSKADSTGLVHRTCPSKNGASSIIRTVISAFIEWLVDQNLATSTETARQHATEKPQSSENTENLDTRQEADLQHASDNHSLLSRKKLVLSLFARSQNQYLFPGSIENSTKHVLDDRQLIKWWCRLLDKLVQKKWNIGRNSGSGISIRETSRTSATIPRDVPSLTAAQSRASTDIIPQAYVIVPGCDRADTVRSFFPPSSQSTAGRKWQNAFPIEHLAHQDPAKADTASIPVRCLVPRLPDDPKARFCDDLDATGTDDKGQWKSIKSISQFWEMMEYRQECAAGRLVGFVWIAFDLSESQTSVAENAAQIAEDQSISTVPQRNGYVEGTDVRFPPTAPDNVLLTSEQYIELSDLLINDTDFAGVECAADSTQTWTEKVKALSNTPVFGVEVVGSRAESLPSSATDANSASYATNGTKTVDDALLQSVNTLIGVRKKKRDAETAGVADSSHITNLDGTSEAVEGDQNTASQSGANLLQSGLLRKKPKIQ